MAKFEIKPSEDGQYYFVLKAPNGEVIAVSETYTTKQSCRHGVKAVQKYAADALIVEQLL